MLEWTNHLTLIIKQRLLTMNADVVMALILAMATISGLSTVEGGTHGFASLLNYLYGRPI